MPYITCHHCFENFDGPRRRARRAAHEKACKPLLFRWADAVLDANQEMVDTIIGGLGDSTIAYPKGDLRSLAQDLKKKEL